MHKYAYYKPLHIEFKEKQKVEGLQIKKFKNRNVWSPK